MDLLFSKYASPYVFLSEITDASRLRDFVVEFAEIENEKKMWDIYLSLVANPYSEVKSFNEFKQSHAKPNDDAKINLEETVRDSHDMLQNFHPGLKVGGET